MKKENRTDRRLRELRKNGRNDNARLGRESRRPDTFRVPAINVLWKPPGK